MKKLMLLSCLLIFSSVTCLWAQTPEGGPLQFDKTTHDFGNLTEGDPATYTFKFKNTGSKDIVLQNVKASCGCTTPKWTTEAVKPGAEGEIQVSYSTPGRLGQINKSITVTYDTAQSPVFLYIRGNVAPKDTATAQPGTTPTPAPHNHDGHNHGPHGSILTPAYPGFRTGSTYNTNATFAAILAKENYSL
ncbi:MAG: DUF1573 domain-containing protein [Sphingobacteriia bacterium]|nr:DUF1573 domain-containing protein [Sphingobacteriia bacterium]